ncbi:hypothetical protein [Streptomyces omiyaensis]|uniref:hypothetical protein n=1 Tax=Streptomyces omiyaensis TaxID=68247 RepID=UPI0016752D06|nr:hypothetical protein [Streptomyces omiyaensis]
MTDTALPSDGEQTIPGARLSPRDEGRLHYASAAFFLADEALEQIPIALDPAPGDLLRAALRLAELADRAVTSAAIAERERGTTWDQIGAAAGTTRQAAHERWHGNVRAWAATGRSDLPAHSPKDSMENAAMLDRYYARLFPEQTTAVSSGLDAVRFPGSREYEGSLRARGAALNARLTVLKDQLQELSNAYRLLKETGDPRALADNLTATADHSQEIASVFRQLAAAEPSLAEEHLHEAQKYEGWAESNRDHAKLYA